MADTKWEIGDNLRTTLRDVITLLTLLVSVWAAAKSTTADQKAGAAVAGTAVNNTKIAGVSKEVKTARNDARKVFGLPPVPTEPDPE